MAVMKQGRGAMPRVTVETRLTGGRSVAKNLAADEVFLSCVQTVRVKEEEDGFRDSFRRAAIFHTFRANLNGVAVALGQEMLDRAGLVPIFIKRSSLEAATPQDKIGHTNCLGIGMLDMLCEFLGGILLLFIHNFSPRIPNRRDLPIPHRAHPCVNQSLPFELRGNYHIARLFAKD